MVTKQRMRRQAARRPRIIAGTPLDIPGLKLWVEADTGLYQASNGTTPASNGDPVGYWADQSGQGNHLIQATTASKPTLRTLLGPGGTRPAVEFDGTDDWMQKAFTLVQPETIFIVFKSTTWTLADHIYEGITAGSMALLQYPTTPKVQTYGGAFGPENGNLAVNTYGIMTALYSGANTMLRVNAGTKVVASGGTNAGGGFTLGARQTGADASNIHVSAVLIYNRDLSASGEDTTVINYLNGKWGVF